MAGSRSDFLLPLGLLPLAGFAFGAGEEEAFLCCPLVARPDRRGSSAIASVSDPLDTQRHQGAVEDFEADSRFRRATGAEQPWVVFCLPDMFRGMERRRARRDAR